MAQQVTTDEIRELRELIGKATPLPWEGQNGTDIFSKSGIENRLGQKADENDGWQIADCAMGQTFVGGDLEPMLLQEQRANRNLILAINALPRLLADSEALGRAEKALVFASLFD